MRSSRIVITLGIMLLLAVLARADRVTSDYDHAVDFSQYKTFMWIQKPKCKEAFMAERIVSAINAQLVAKGLSEVSENANIAVGANFATEEQHELETYYSGSSWWGWDGRWPEAYYGGPGWRGWDGGWDAGWSTTRVKTYEVGTVTVELFDARSRRLAWQGVGTDELSARPEKRTREIDKEIQKMFKDFPPGTRD